MTPEPLTREEALAALERTLGGGPARFEFRQEFNFDFDVPKSRPDPVRLGPRLRGLARRPGRESLAALLRAIGRRLIRPLGRAAISLALGVSKRGARRYTGLPVEGVVDYEAHRCMYRHPKARQVTLVVGDRSWHGDAGAAAATIRETPASALQPLWLLDLLRGIEEGFEPGEEEILEGHTCRRFAGNADLLDAAGAVSYELWVPTGAGSVGQLRRVPVELWLDSERRIRRIRHRAVAPDGRLINTTSIEILELGVEPPPDWSRLHLGW